MSVESKASKAAKVTSVGIAAFSAGTFIAIEVLKRREQKERVEFMQQTAGDSGILFQRDGSRSR